MKLKIRDVRRRKREARRRGRRKRRGTKEGTRSEVKDMRAVENVREKEGSQGERKRRESSNGESGKEVLIEERK